MPHKVNPSAHSYPLLTVLLGTRRYAEHLMYAVENLTATL